MSVARRTALVSLLAALLLAVAKLLVGLATGSLAILAEAVHSGVDAVAALVTFWAVAVAERPADPEHPYGHGKAQYLAALAEGTILAGAAIWIAVEALGRLTGSGHAVEAAWYAFALLGGVLLVDALRATLSYRAGRTERSSALIANALHFASDFAGTLAVLVGLVLVRAGVNGGDSVAAIFVAALVLVAAGRLSARNVDALMDRAPSGVARRVEEAALGVPGVNEVRGVRVRESGGQNFAELTIGVSRLAGLERSHEMMDRVEEAITSGVGPTQVTVHVEPTAGGERPTERVAAAALRVPGVVETHNIAVLEGPAGRAITLHVRVDEYLSLDAARGVVERLKDEIRREFGVARVYAHVEPFAPGAQPARDVSASEPELRRAAWAAVRSVAGEPAELVVYRQGRRLLVVTSLAADGNLSVRDAHALASRVEDVVRETLDGVDDVIVEVT